MDDGRMAPFETWPTIPLAQDQAAGPHTLAYLLHEDRVLLGGRVTRANGGQYTSGHPWLLGTIPEDARPTGSYWATMAAVEPSGPVYVARIEIHTDGSLLAWIPPGGTAKGLRWIALDGTSYPNPQSAATAA